MNVYRKSRKWLVLLSVLFLLCCFLSLALLQLMGLSLLVLPAVILAIVVGTILGCTRQVIIVRPKELQIQSLLSREVISYDDIRHINVGKEWRWFSMRKCVRLTLVDHGIVTVPELSGESSLGRLYQQLLRGWNDVKEGGQAQTAEALPQPTDVAVGTKARLIYRRIHKKSIPSAACGCGAAAIVSPKTEDGTGLGRNWSELQASRTRRLLAGSMVPRRSPEARRSLLRKMSLRQNRYVEIDQAEEYQRQVHTYKRHVRQHAAVKRDSKHNTRWNIILLILIFLCLITLYLGVRSRKSRDLARQRTPSSSAPLFDGGFESLK